MSDGSANGVAGSRWGVRVSEDLGDGLKALSVLENGFRVNNGILGQGGAMFGRQAFVGLTSANAGSLTFGRQYDTYTGFAQPLTATGQWAGYINARDPNVSLYGSTPNKGLATVNNLGSFGSATTPQS
ncbi:porin [Paraburkholderia sp. BR14312]|uniref:porin n=1 Tax=unclassified Paraburkholderia TaxID=2615204 RepID=UPI0034CF4713